MKSWWKKNPINCHDIYLCFVVETHLVLLVLVLPGEQRRRPGRRGRQLPPPCRRRRHGRRGQVVVGRHHHGRRLHHGHLLRLRLLQLRLLMRHHELVGQLRRRLGRLRQLAADSAVRAAAAATVHHGARVHVDGGHTAVAVRVVAGVLLLLLVLLLGLLVLLPAIVGSWPSGPFALIEEK